MADRIGVINKGELILVEDKAALMRKLGKKQLTLQLQEPLTAVPGGAGRLRRWSWPTDGNELVYTFDTQASDTGIAASAAASSTSSASSSRTCRPAQSSLEDIFVSLVRARAMNVHADPRDLPLRDGAHLAHADAEHRLAGDHDLALLRRVRLGDRLAHDARSTASATAPSSCRA